MSARIHWTRTGRPPAFERSTASAAASASAEFGDPVSAPDPVEAGVEGAEEHLDLLLVGHRLDDRSQLLLELTLQFRLEVLHFLLGVVREPLQLGLHAVDVLLQLAPGGVTQDRGARLELLLGRLQGLVAVVELGDLLIVEGLDTRGQCLAL